MSDCTFGLSLASDPPQGRLTGLPAPRLGRSAPAPRVRNRDSQGGAAVPTPHHVLWRAAPSPPSRSALDRNLRTRDLRPAARPHGTLTLAAKAVSLMTPYSAPSIHR